MPLKGQRRDDFHKPPEDWTDAEIQTLRRLWAEGLPGSQIGAMMGRTKSAIIGKAHRLDLPARASPIRPGAAPSIRAIQVRAIQVRAKREREKLSPAEREQREAAERATATAAQRADPAVREARAKLRARLDEEAAKAHAAPPPQLVPPKREPKVAECCWPIGDGRAMTFCCQAALPGRPYCELHTKAAYVPRSAISPRQSA